MASVTTEQRFHGTVALMVLHLRRLAKSNDVDEGFAAARGLSMIDDTQERFMRGCLALDRSFQPVSPEESGRGSMPASRPASPEEGDFGGACRIDFPRGECPASDDDCALDVDGVGRRVTDDLIKRLQACILSINSADPA